MLVIVAGSGVLWSKIQDQASINNHNTIMTLSTRASAGKASTYVSRLRRAFLLRVHPDRFGSRYSDQIRKQQASLVQGAYNESMFDPRE